MHSDPAAVSRAAATITAVELVEKVGVLAHDSMRGRATPSPELDATSQWVATRFEALGLEAPFSGSFEQRYIIRTAGADSTTTWITSGGADTLRMPTDLALPFGPPAADRVREGGVVFTDLDADLEDDVAVEGRHVVVLADAASDFRSRVAVATIGNLRQAGVASVWLVTRTDPTVQSWRTANALQGMQARTVVGDGSDEVPVISVRRPGLVQLLGQGAAAMGMAVDEGGFLELPDVRMTLRTGLTVIAEDQAPNVAGILRGSDPALSSEYVVYSAHMDHVGVGRPDAQGDSIFNGADDDASGTAAVLEIAEAFASLETPPRRSLIFLLVSGEERGLWGSQHFVANSPVPIESLVADLNADMVGRNWSDTIVAIGKEHSELGPMLERGKRPTPRAGNDGDR